MKKRWRRIVPLSVIVVVVTVILAATLAPRPPASSNTPIAAAPNCSQYDTGIGNQIAAFNASQRPTWKPAGATYAAGTYFDREQLYDLFYSPRLNTCVSVIEDQTLIKSGSSFIVHEDSYNLADASTGELIDWIYITKHGSPYDTLADVGTKIAEYQAASSSPIILGTP